MAFFEKVEGYTGQEVEAARTNGGILRDAPPRWDCNQLIEHVISLEKLLLNQEEWQTNNRALLRIALNALNAAGLAAHVLSSEIEQAPDLDKDELLSFCGQLQRQGEEIIRADSEGVRGHYYLDAALALRQFLQKNYRLAIGPVKGSRK